MINERTKSILNALVIRLSTNQCFDIIEEEDWGDEWGDATDEELRTFIYRKLLEGVNA